MVHYLIEEEGTVSARFRFGSGVNRLSVTLAYRPYLVSFNRDGSPINCPQERLAKAIKRQPPTTHNLAPSSSNTHNNAPGKSLLIGAEFERNMVEYRIVSTNHPGVDGTTLFCVCQELHGGEAVEGVDAVRMEQDLVTELVAEYLE